MSLSCLERISRRSLSLLASCIALYFLITFWWLDFADLKRERAAALSLSEAILRFLSAFSLAFRASRISVGILGFLGLGTLPTSKCLFVDFAASFNMLLVTLNRIVATSGSVVSW